MKSLNNANLMEKRETHMARLKSLFDGDYANPPLFLDGANGQSSKNPFIEPEKWVEEALVDLERYAGMLESDDEVFHPLVLECWLYGVHFTDKLFGCEVSFYTDLWWSKGLENPIGEMPVPDLEKNETWRQAKALALAMVNAGTKLPFICPQVLGAPFNQAFNLYKERLLTAFYDRPDKVKRDLGVITDTLCEMHRWYQNNVPPDQFQPSVASGRCQPRGFGQMCGCATQLISAQIYDEFVAPLDDMVLSMYQTGGMYHLCGAHTQHVKRWREMKRFRAFQLNDRASEDLEIYFNGLRDDQIIYLNPTATMTRKRAMEITGGRRLVICGRF